LNGKGPLSEEEKKLIKEEIERYDEVLDLIEKDPNPKDSEAIMNLWDGYIDAIEERLDAA